MKTTRGAFALRTMGQDVEVHHRIDIVLRGMGTPLGPRIMGCVAAAARTAGVRVPTEAPAPVTSRRA